MIFSHRVWGNDLATVAISVIYGVFLSNNSVQRYTNKIKRERKALIIILMCWYLPELNLYFHQRKASCSSDFVHWDDPGWYAPMWCFSFELPTAQTENGTMVYLTKLRYPYPQAAVSVQYPALAKTSDSQVVEGARWAKPASRSAAFPVYRVSATRRILPARQAKCGVCTVNFQFCSPYS